MEVRKQQMRNYGYYMYICVDTIRNLTFGGVKRSPLKTEGTYRENKGKQK